MTTQPIDITPLIQAIIALLAVLVTTFCIPAIKRYTTEKERENLMVWVNVAVKAAEQLAKSGVIDKEERLNKVYEFLQSKNLIVDFDEVSTLIQAYVKDLPPFISNSDNTNITEKDAEKIENKVTENKVDAAIKEMIKSETDTKETQEEGKG